MANVFVRNLDEKTVELLKVRAKRHRRSLQSELAAILETAAGVEPIDPIAILDQFRERMKDRPQTTDSTDLIREDRDSNHGHEY
jgi:plasmid stability protein